MSSARYSVVEGADAQAVEGEGDETPHGFRRVSLVPVAPSEPVADLGGVALGLKTSRADQSTVLAAAQREDEAVTAGEIVRRRGDPSSRHVFGIGAGKAGRPAGDVRVAAEPADERGFGRAESVEQQPPGLDGREGAHQPRPSPPSYGSSR